MHLKYFCISYRRTPNRPDGRIGAVPPYRPKGLGGVGTVRLPACPPARPMGLGGGESVQSADDCEAAGLSVPALPQEIRDELRGFTPLAGCSVRNPVDSSMVMSPEDYSKTVRLVSGWSGIDLMLAYVVIDLLPSSVVKPDMVNMMVGSVVEASKASAKPMAVVFSPGASAGQQGVENLRRFHLAGLPVYHNVSGAARAISKYIQYHERIRPE